MTDCTVTLAFDDDAGQMVLEDLPAGPAGEAGLIPAPGIELLFDRADGRLSRMFVDAGQDDLTALNEAALAFTTALLGMEAGAAIAQAHPGSAMTVTLRPDEGTVADLSRLARLDAARVTSPLAQSSWWSVEAAQLAARAGLKERAAAEIRQAVRAMTDETPTLAGLPAAAVLATAELVETTQPELGRRLRDRAALPRPDHPPAAYSDRGWGALPPFAMEGLEPDSDNAGGLQWSLDAQMIPPHVFGFGLWPDCDLTVNVGESGILVEAELAPGADRAVLAGCRARLVDPSSRAVVGAAPFRDAGGSRVRADIHHQAPSGAWVEVAGEASHPVISGQLRHIRQAMRWADAALVAGRRPPGPGDAQWPRLAGLAWKRCAEYWYAAQDPDRAYLAAARAATTRPDVAIPAPRSAWAKELAGRPSLEEAPFLAEIAG
jgi:hypothetical protein